MVSSPEVSNGRMVRHHLEQKGQKREEVEPGDWELHTQRKPEQTCAVGTGSGETQALLEMLPTAETQGEEMPWRLPSAYPLVTCYWPNLLGARDLGNVTLR